MMTRLRRIFLAVSLSLTLVAPSLFAQDTGEQVKRRAALEKEIAQLQAQIKANSGRSANALSELALIRKQISNRRSLLDESDREIRVITDSITAARRRYNTLRAQLDTMTVYYQRLVKGAYRNRDAKTWYVYVFASDNLSQAARRYAYLRNLSSYMNVQAAKIKEAQTELEAQLEQLEGMKRRAESMRAAREKELEKLRGEEKKSDTLIANLKRDKTKYQKQLNTKRRQVEALNKEIERIIAAYVAENDSKSSKGGGKSAAAVNYELAAEFEANKGKLPWPADGPVVEKFGKHTHPVYTSIVMPFNNGIGIALGAGETVSVVFDGEVKRVILMPGYNKCVLVSHGNYFTFYCKLGTVKVKAGDKVRTGQAIGTVDTIDGQTQLHFQVWKGKTPQNPEGWLRKK